MPPSPREATNKGLLISCRPRAHKIYRLDVMLPVDSSNKISEQSLMVVLDSAALSRRWMLDPLSLICLTMPGSGDLVRLSPSSTRVVLVTAVVLTEIPGILLGAGGRWRGGLRIFLKKETVLGFLSSQHMVFCLMPSLNDLAGDEFKKAPSEISIERLMPIDCWIG
jgi:hypothetical protein